MVAGVCALALYARCLAPGLTWAHDGADGGDLLAAALAHGVPHPSGYPTYQLLLRVAIALFPGEPARAGNWLSAVCAATAVALLANLATRMLPPRSGRNPVALAAALTWAASPALWSQAVITEVYALNALLVVSLLWLLWRWRDVARALATADSSPAGVPRWAVCRGQDGQAGQAGQATPRDLRAVAARHPGWPWLAASGFVLGIGMGNHLSLALILPGVAVWLWANRQDLVSMRARHWAAVLAAVGLGLSVYIYLPLAASGDPAVNWGDPETLSGFGWVVSGQIYRGLVLALERSLLLSRMAAWAGEASRQFAGGPWGALIALAGLWWLDRHDHAWWQTTVVIGAVFSIYAIGYNTADSYVYLIPVWAVVALWLAAGLFWGIESLRKAWPLPDRSGALQALAMLLLVALPVISLIRFWDRMDLSSDGEAQAFVTAVLKEALPRGLILTAGDRPTFALWYAVYGKGLRPDLTPININLYAYPWYQQTLMTHHSLLAQQLRHGKLPPLEQLVAEIVQQQPVYRAELLDLDFKGLTEHRLSTLVQMGP